MNRTFDFNNAPSRINTDSYKWDSAEHDIIPLWVADMDFKTAPCIIEALRRRVDHGVYGYTRVPDEYYSAVTNWFGKNHGLKIRPEEIIYTSGVVPAVSAAIKATTMPGEGVIVQTPVYNCFFSSIRNNGCRVVENRLAIDSDGRYHIDFDQLRRLAADPMNTAMLLCNPHNPTGRVWRREELEQLGEICIANNLTVISDEIHCELTFAGNRYTPFASISEEFARHAITCISPTKAFNIAGLQIANIVINDAELRRRVDRAININEVCDVNPFGVRALIAAYNEGQPWLTALKEYLWDNYLYLRNFFERNCPRVKVTPLEGTYLAWMDCRALGLTDKELHDKLMNQARVWVHPGNLYGETGSGFIRINFACPRATLEEALRRIADYL